MEELIAFYTLLERMERRDESGITAVQTERVQRILNAAACLVLRIPKFVPVSALIRDSLHWLPAAQPIKFKILLLVANCINQRAPLYLQELCVIVSAVPRVGTYGLLTSSAWWSIAVGYHRCRSGDLLLQDRWRGTIFQRLHVFR